MSKSLEFWLRSETLFLPMLLCLKIGINEHVILKVWGFFIDVKENKTIEMSQPFEDRGQKILLKYIFFPSSLAPEHMNKFHWS